MKKGLEELIYDLKCIKEGRFPQRKKYKGLIPDDCAGLFAREWAEYWLKQLLKETL